MSLMKGTIVEALLEFFSDLLLFTAGLAVVFFWILVFAILAIEAWDAIFEKNPKDEEES